MELVVENAQAWSETIFGTVELGDKRLTKRLVQIGVSNYRHCQAFHYQKVVQVRMPY